MTGAPGTGAPGVVVGLAVRVPRVDSAGFATFGCSTDAGPRGPTFEEGLRLFGYEMGSHYVGDLLQHSGDVRHALNRARPADDEALVVALDFYLDSFDQALTGAGPGAVELTVADEHWTLGLGETVASVAAERYELLRCLGGRRSEAQDRALQWQGDIDAILPVVSRTRSNRSR